MKGASYPNTFRCMLLGGGPAPVHLLEACKEKGIPVYQTYGMTETSSQIVTLAPEYSMTKIGSAGKPLFPSQLRIEMTAMMCEPGAAGEIVVSGPNVTKAISIGWMLHSRQLPMDGFILGTLVISDEEGFLYVLDRRSDLIISGGENVYPAEIENVLSKHPDVFEAGVTGTEDEKWGQVPLAFVVLHQASEQYAGSGVVSLIGSSACSHRYADTSARTTADGKAICAEGVLPLGLGPTRCTRNLDFY